MKLFSKTTQFIGEGVGVFEKTEEDADFKQQANYFHATTDATNKLVAGLMPESTKGIMTDFATKMGRDVKLKTEEQKRGEELETAGTTLAGADPTGHSDYANAIISLGQSLKEVGEAHANHDKQLMEVSMGPMRAWQEEVIKEVTKLEKNYDNKRMDYDAARRASSKKKVDSEAQAKTEHTKKKYEEAKDTYLEHIAQLKSYDKQRVKELREYCEHQATYFGSIVELYNRAAKKLEDIESQVQEYTPPAKTSHSSSYAAEPIATPAASAPVTTRAPPPIPPNRGQQKCRALYDFTGASAQELSFKTGDIINVVRSINADWWEGELNGSVGLVPGNYVQMI